MNTVEHTPEREAPPSAAALYVSIRRARQKTAPLIAAAAIAAAAIGSVFAGETARDAPDSAAQQPGRLVADPTDLGAAVSVSPLSAPTTPNYADPTGLGAALSVDPAASKPPFTVDPTGLIAALERSHRSTP